MQKKRLQCIIPTLKSWQDNSTIVYGIRYAIAESKVPVTQSTEWANTTGLQDTIERTRKRTMPIDNLSASSSLLTRRATKDSRQAQRNQPCMHHKFRNETASGHREDSLCKIAEQRPFITFGEMQFAHLNSQQVRQKSKLLIRFDNRTCVTHPRPKRLQHWEP